jgi:hypothetical protein
MAKKLGFRKVSDEKKVVARAIKDYMAKGGFVFAMCSAPETMDIALAAENVDIVPTELDGDPVDPDCHITILFVIIIFLTIVAKA